MHTDKVSLKKDYSAIKLLLSGTDKGTSREARRVQNPVAVL